jgi:hypothetical protein
VKHISGDMRWRDFNTTYETEVIISFLCSYFKKFFLNFLIAVLISINIGLFRYISLLVWQVNYKECTTR